jgi:hypothetical protein
MAFQILQYLFAFSLNAYWLHGGTENAHVMCTKNYKKLNFNLPLPVLTP